MEEEQNPNLETNESKEDDSIETAQNLEKETENQEEQSKEFGSTGNNLDQNLRNHWASRHNKKNTRIARSAKSLFSQKSKQLNHTKKFSREKARAEIQQAIVRARERKEFLKYRALREPDES